MSKKRLTIVFIVVGILIITSAVLKQKNGNLVSPNLIQTKKVTTAQNLPKPTPSPTPKTFKFDKTTDLKAELDLVNPQVLDSDFGE